MISNFFSRYVLLKVCSLQAQKVKLLTVFGAKKLKSDSLHFVNSDTNGKKLG